MPAPVALPGRPLLSWHGKRAPPRLEPVAARLQEVYGAPVNGWRNQLYWGDNLDVIAHVLPSYRGQVDLIYLDPPFDSNAEYAKTIHLHGDLQARASFEERQYSDSWGDDSYLQFMYERLIAMRELLAPTGCLFLHCDWHRSAQLRCLLDEIFGRECFRNEIVWHYYNKLQGNVGRFAANHDTLLFYSRSDTFTFNRLREPRERPVRQIKRVWSTEKRSIVNAKDKAGRVVYTESTHKTIDDVWRLPMLQPADRTEAVGYPTQKPEALLERVIAAGSRPGALVFDGFMGSGTALAVAVKLGRRCIGADANLGAVHAATRRLSRIDESCHRGAPTLIKNGLFAGGNELGDVERRYLGVEVWTTNDAAAQLQDGDATVRFNGGKLQILDFSPRPLLRRLAEQGIEFDGWRSLVDSVLVDFDYDGAVLRPTVRDIPTRGQLVAGEYAAPSKVGVTRVKITDLLSDVFELTVPSERD